MRQLCNSGGCPRIVVWITADIEAAIPEPCIFPASAYKQSWSEHPVLGNGQSRGG
jgi:hypothetical protein